MREAVLTSASVRWTGFLLSFEEKLLLSRECKHVCSTSDKCDHSNP